jgi:hypothetical protein
VPSSKLVCKDRAGLHREHQKELHVDDNDALNSASKHEGKMQKLRAMSEVSSTLETVGGVSASVFRHERPSAIAS